MKEYFIKKCENAFSPVPNWVQRLATLTMGAKLTYGRLLQCANDEGVAWPSQRYLSRELGCSLRSIVKYIGELRKHDLVTVSKIRVNGFPRTVYRFVVPEDQRELPELPKEDDSLPTPHVLTDDSAFSFCTTTETYYYDADDECSSQPVQQFSLAPSPVQEALDGSAAECNTCTGVRNFYTQGMQGLHEGYADSALVYNDDKNKEKNSIQKQTQHTSPYPLLNTASTSKAPHLGEGSSCSSSTCSSSCKKEPAHPHTMDNRNGSTLRSSSIPSGNSSMEFETVWELYPLKQGKNMAQSHWNHLAKQGKLPALSVILESIKAHLVSDSRWKRGILMNLERWLREERWTDEPFTKATTSDGISMKQQFELNAAQQLKSIREAVKGYAIKITDPVTEQVLESYGGIDSLSRMPERNLPFVFSTFIKEYTALSLSMGKELAHA
ncbi:helix-turn-helix domain-containing protein [Halodesulfovibrio sp.]|jgi:hypothetical protein|uniref:helix-turn-helix domain-containing protein n=1 Tax=Halodesulfovibrio sp. TaxID=1912772 RepID=UPI0025D70623|nr:helix-turn-helix domain-containing protein [Halodesulfovibrio sp.]MCT4533741.1 helix-turn-helix domain-containing protein [Halodesulfovibrio sp.]